MKQPFMYKYKPKRIEEFEIDNKLINIINTFIDMDNLNIILYGHSGCGKTSLINCIIKKYYNINDINDAEINNQNNILIINSLKDQGISYYRNEVKTFCQIMCSVPQKKKIIVIDDIDTINEQSQQVFRNCIDKYGSNVHFIVSCNNIQKVIDSIQSRLMIIKIKQLETYNIENIITKICDKEKMKISEEARKFIISISNNSVRTIINYLEKFKLISNDITYEIAINVCTNISFNDLTKFTNLCKINKNLIEAIKQIQKIYDSGYSVMDILDNYFLFVKLTDILTENEKYLIIKLICKYISIFYNIHEDEIELVLFTNNLINIFA